MKNHRTLSENAELLPCPTCGTEDTEMLVWDTAIGEVDLVICPVCGTRYNPFTGELWWSL